MFKRTGSGDLPDYLKCLISGPAKSGKTTTLGTVPNIVIADTEPHANNLQSVAHLDLPYVTVYGTDDLRKLAVVLRDPALRAQAAADLGMPDIEAVGIDTLDTLQEIMKKERLAAERRTEFRKDDWGWLREQMTSVIRSFTALPMHVFFTVHVKTVHIGSDEDGRTVVQPGLQGGISEDIAGMVGYSLYSFRTGEVGPDGRPTTKYWLQAEGDETFPFVGNRAAGRLPRVIEPNFATLQAAAAAGKLATRPSPVVAPVAAPVAPPVPETPAPAPEATQATPVATEPLPQPGPAQQSQQVEKPEAPVGIQGPSGEGVQGPPPADVSPDAQPINLTALKHVKDVYMALGVDFPEDLVRSKTIGEARTLVLTWRAAQEDEANGRLAEGGTAKIEMLAYMEAFNWLAEVPRPKASDKVETILFWVGFDVARANEMYQAELQRPSPRKTLLTALEERGATAASDEGAAPAAQEAPVKPPLTVESVKAAQVAAEAEAARLAEAEAQANALAAAEAAGWTETESEPTQAEAVEALAQGVGAEVVQVVDNRTGKVAPCEMCAEPIDDEDIAELSMARFKLWQCISCYKISVNGTKK